PDVVEVRAQIDVNRSRLVHHDGLRHALHGGMSGSFRAIAIRPRLKVGFEDRFQDEFHGTLDDAITDCGDREDTHTFAACLRYLPVPQSLRSIRLRYEFISELL